MIKGLISPILSPFNDDLSFNEDLYVSLAKDLLEKGCSGLAPFGTTGEALSISFNERISALEALVDSGIDPSNLIPGTGLCNLYDTVELSKHALEVGCAGVMTLPPFYFKGVSDDGLFTYFSKFIELVNKTELKIYLYHIPQVSGTPLSIELVKKLKHSFPEQIIGIKDSSGNWENTSSLLNIKDLIVYPGTELPVIDAIKLGAPGCISATANFNSVDISKVIACCFEKKWEIAEELHKNVKQVRMLFQEYSPIPSQKSLLSRLYREDKWKNVRPPIIKISEKKIDNLINNLNNKFGFKI